ncbi:GNAT family N-acetyltransferase [Zongyangia sp. HA2173]|uniref:GNAT family N-acetyltransferase n=1 Tax=Zongyangia sp. HA2173 TaxID=3133035 RepID=UPI00315E4679
MGGLFAVCGAGSPYAVPIYRQLGFVETGGEQIADGMRFTPMKFERSLPADGRA